MAGVILKKVSKIFDKKVVAVDRVDIEIADQEFVVLVGPSGCGKSTTLRMIAGLEEITSGELYIGDSLVNDIPPKDRDIAMVFQNYALYPHMSVFDNMAFGLKLRKVAKSEIADRVQEAAGILGIQELLDRKPKALSGGQRQRVAVGRAIVRKPQVFLFDEPLSNLDAKLRVQMRTEISKLHDTLKTTMIYVTHDQVEAMTMGDRIVVMKEGVIQQIDPPLSLYNSPKNKFVAGFIGSPAMNLLAGRIVKDGELWFVTNSYKLRLLSTFSDKIMPYVDKEVVFGIRPEDVHDSRFALDLAVNSGARFDIEVVEPMGSEVYLHLASESEPFIARLNTQLEYTVGGNIEVVFNMEKAHFFDIETERAILI
ncbi:sn-glycerol-3-phosphate ABC transporter ATP-binding protein UgpC [bacterium]|nr:sn-glycerol-3-phosphate ABC transporter ATP-binding protein UgpC [bacterium]